MWEVLTHLMGWIRGSWVLPTLSPQPASQTWPQFPPAPKAVPGDLPIRLGASLSAVAWGEGYCRLQQRAGSREL